jgi:hypothetical protein
LRRSRDARLGRTVTEGQDLQPVVTGKFVLVPNPGRGDPNRVYRVRFHAELAGAG